MELVVLRTTLGDKTQAKDLARRLIGSRLACCVHTWPIRSTYEWEGTIEESDEEVVEAKTVPANRQAVWDAITASHPYEVPLLEAFTVEASASYVRWATEVTSSRPRD